MGMKADITDVLNHRETFRLLFGLQTVIALRIEVRLEVDYSDSLTGVG